MAVSPVIPSSGGSVGLRFLGRARLVFLLALLSLLVLCGILSWVTRDAMAHLPFLKGRGGASNAAKTLVDLRPWLTAQALAPLAVTAEETEFARDAERLADHEVDQAFASALRKAGMEAQRRTLTGEALALSNRVTQLQELVNEDQALVKRLGSAATVPAEAKPLAEELQKINDGRRRGPQLLGDILPIVLARLGVGAIQSGESGE